MNDQANRLIFNQDVRQETTENFDPGLNIEKLSENAWLEPFVLPEKTTEHWRCRKEWVTHDGKPNFTHLKKHFGTATVPIANCSIKHYNAQLKEDMLLSDYISYWTALIADQYDFVKHNNLYLKDWHFMKEFPSVICYEIPACFSSDWLNEFWNQRQDEYDDYKFVYMGPKGSWTPLHVDVFSSYSWSANICGVKKWILFPPEEEENLKDNAGRLAYDITSPVMLDNRRFPKYHKVKTKLEILQKSGEIIFVPSLWLHQVHNMEDTVSINHNWFNGFNINIIWRSLFAMHKKVEIEISECKDMEGWNEQCQLILKATHGMNFTEFETLLVTIAKTRIVQLDQLLSSKSSHDSNLTMEDQTLLDLKKIMATLSIMIQDCAGNDLGNISALQKMIQNNLDNYKAKKKLK